MCDHAALHPVRDDAGPRPGHGRRAVRLLRALRLGARRAGRIPARAAGAVHPHQGSRGPAGFAVRLPVRRPAHRLAGRRIRRHPRRRLGDGAGPRPDRRHGGAHRAATSATTSSPSTGCPNGWPAPTARGIRTVDLAEHDDKLGDVIRDLTDGRGTDSVIDAVGMEAHGSPVAKIAQQVTGLLPDAIAKPMMQKAGVDRLDALYSAIDIVRRGGTISLIGVYGGMADPLPMLTLVRQADSAADGPGERQEVGRRHHAAADRRRPAGRRHLRHPHPAARRGAPRLRDLPEEAGRRGQGDPQALTNRYLPRRDWTSQPGTPLDTHAKGPGLRI